MVVLICGFVVGALAIGLNAGSEGRYRGSTQPAEQPQSTRLQIDIFELSCKADQLAKLSLDEIGANGASVEHILGRLTSLGQARVVVRMDDTIALPGEASLTTAQRTPVVTDVVLSKGGVVTPSVNYEEVGAIAEISGRWLGRDETDRAQLQLSVEFASVVHSHTEIGSKVKLPSFTECNLEKSLIVHSGKPVLTLTNLIPDPMDNENPLTAYVVRTVVTRLGS
jgi:hypothetical protein